MRHYRRKIYFKFKSRAILHILTIFKIHELKNMRFNNTENVYFLDNEKQVFKKVKFVILRV